MLTCSLSRMYFFTEKVLVWKDIIDMKHYNVFHIHFHPNDVNRQGIALVQLDEAVMLVNYIKYAFAVQRFKHSYIISFQ